MRTLEFDAFVRSIDVNKGSPHALFLGAGASMTSGVPSAWTCVLYWKRHIFETNNPHLKSAVAEISLPSVQNRIDTWLKANGIWPASDEDDYTYFIEKCLPIEEDRRKYFHNLIKGATPHIGYRLLGLLGEQGLIRSIWTTNFDGLAAKSILAESSQTPVEIGIDCQMRLERQDSSDEIICVSLHGDYRYDKLKNTNAELQSQEADLEIKLVETLNRQSLIVSGYSGRDQSIMAAFAKALVNQNSKCKVYWCDYSQQPKESVARLLQLAHQAGREAFYVPNVSFDELQIRLARQCLTDTLATRAEKIIGSTSIVSSPSISPFTIKSKNVVGLIKSNAFSLTLPSEVFSFNLSKWPDAQRWKWLRERSTNGGFVAVPFHDAVIALATVDQIKAEFGNEIDGQIERVPITDTDLKIVDGAVHSLLKESLTQSIATYRDLETNGKDRVWERRAFTTERLQEATYSVHRCACFSFRHIDSRLHVAIDPTFFVPALEGAENRGHHETRKKKLGYQHNDAYAKDLEYWRSKLVGETKENQIVEFDFPPKTAAFKFKVNFAPSFAEISDDRSRPISVKESFRSMIPLNGLVFGEPSLLFATKAGWNPCDDTFPLRGLANHGPYDAQSVKELPRSDIPVAVICPKGESRFFSQFLATSDRRAAASRTGEYVVDFKGFSDTFGCKLVIPNESDPDWITLPEISSSLNDNPLKGCQEWTQNLCEALTKASSLGRNIALIASPDRWSKFRIAETEDHIYNVHDDVKAFAVRKGMATQFIDQDTLTPYDNARIWWWLSIAIYTKAMRTPWVLKALDPDTAFVGLGYSVDRKAEQEKVVLGCSHIYNAQGQGLQFRLRNIRDPMIRRDKNPYMNFNESRQMGEMIRQLFWESHLRLPERVVVHKLFPFTVEEVKGIKAGLSGVKSLEMLEINHESSLRYLSSKFENGKFAIDGYPVRRGTSLKMSNDELLLWVHGATSALNEHKTYFQGKRRIPSPVVVRRYSGTSDVATIVSELLGLSKMDWNSGELYSKLPATVQTAKTIARIGRRLSALGHTSFDYRLFM